MLLGLYCVFVLAYMALGRYLLQKQYMAIEDLKKAELFFDNDFKMILKEEKGKADFWWAFYMMFLGMFILVGCIIGVVQFDLFELVAR